MMDDNQWECKSVDNISEKTLKYLVAVEGLLKVMDKDMSHEQYRKLLDMIFDEETVVEFG